VSRPVLARRAAHARRLEGRWVATWVSDPNWRVYHNLDRGARVEYAGGSVALGPSKVVVIPGWLRWYGPLAGSVRHRWLSFTLPHWSASWSRRSFDAVVVREAADPELAVVMAAFDLAEQGPRSGAGWSQAEWCRLQAACYQALGLYLEAYPPLAGHDPGRLAGLLDHIDRHPAEDLRLATLAQREHCSPAHLSRRFAATIGQSVGSYVRESRIAHAALLLAEGEASIERIAAECGFSDRYHFSRVFKRVMRQTPAAYRDQQRHWIGD